MGGVVHFTKRTFDIDRPTINLPVASVSPPTSKNGRNGKKKWKIETSFSRVPKRGEPTRFPSHIHHNCRPPVFWGVDFKTVGVVMSGQENQAPKKGDLVFNYIFFAHFRPIFGQF